MRIFYHFLALLFSFSTLTVYSQIKNLANPIEGVYRGGWLHNAERDFKGLKKLGINTIINLHTSPDDEKLCSKFKMNCIHKSTIILPWVETFYTTPKTIIESYWLVKDLINQNEKVYIHCLHGSDRTGLLVAALEMDHIKKKQSAIFDLEDLDPLIERLHFHKYHHFLFPGIKLKIFNWAAKTPQWFFKKPLCLENSSC